MSASLAVGQERKIAPGDAIEIIVYDNPELSRTVVVGPEGTMDFPFMQGIPAKLKNTYGLTILDAPPLIAVTDSIVLSTEVDGVCPVIRSGRTRQDAALRARQLLENSRSRIIGIILNDIDLKDVYKYYKDYYSNDGQKREQYQKEQNQIGG